MGDKWEFGGGEGILYTSLLAVLVDPLHFLREERSGLFLPTACVRGLGLGGDMELR